jgi:hypothetical protein
MACAFLNYEMQILIKVNSLWPYHGQFSLYGFYRVIYFLYFVIISLSLAMLNYGTKNQSKKNVTPFFPSDLVFNMS